jgi:hypothetical protein
MYALSTSHSFIIIFDLTLSQIGVYKRKETFFAVYVCLCVYIYLSIDLSIRLSISISIYIYTYVLYGHVT